MGKLTKPQLKFLADLGEQPAYAAEGYAPANRLVALGYAERRGHWNTLVSITKAGRAALEALPQSTGTSQ